MQNHEFEKIFVWNQRHEGFGKPSQNESEIPSPAAPNTQKTSTSRRLYLHHAKNHVYEITILEEYESINPFNAV